MSRYLVLNPNPEGLDKVVTKANVQNQKNGPFEAVLFLGDAYLAWPSQRLDVPSFVIEGKGGEIQPQPDVNETNYNRLDEPVVQKTLDLGTKVMFVGASAETDLDSHVEEVTEPVDILVTYDWPWAIARQENYASFGNKQIDKLVNKVRPTYHFAVGPEHTGKFFENRPFRWSDGRHTRFISLGQEGSGDKWYYAFKLEEETIDDSQAIANPFTTVSRKREAPDDEAALIERKRRQLEPKVVSPSECFFCLSNPNVETHMIAAIGKHSYLTTAKGPLTRPLKNLAFTGHVIIIPIQHIPTLKDHQETNAEMNKFQQAIIDSYANTEYVPIFFEISRALNVHFHVQCVPVPKLKLEKFESVLTQKALQNNERYHDRNQKLEFEKLEDGTTPDGDFIRFTIGNPTRTYFVARLLEPDKMIDLQFPRRVLAVTLNLTKRIYWNQCKQPKFVETEECDEFKKFFKPHDFTIELS